MPPKVNWLPLLLCGILLQGAPSAGQDRAPVGVLDATAHGEILAGAPVRIRKPDASESSERIARLFQNELSRRGFRVADTGSAHVLAFRFTSDVSVDPEPYPMVELKPREQNPSYDEEATAVLRLGRRGGSDPTGLRSRTQILLVELTDLKGALLWSARATPLVAADTLYGVATAIVPPLLNHMGETVYAADLR